MRYLPPIVISVLLSGCFAATNNAQSIERAQLYNKHGLDSEAKSECILIITSDRPDTEKATAYYILGLIAFDQDRIATALESWTDLVEKFPESEEASEVADRIKDLAEIVGASQRESIDNAIARAYLRHGDFWSREKDSIFTIDSSWIPEIEAAIKWYDKTIENYPNTPAARIAFEEKMRAILDWEGSGRYAEDHGVKDDPAKYIPMLVQAFTAYEKAFPEAGAQQAFRYQIAQAYWDEKDWMNTRAWLNAIVEKSENRDSFYPDLARRRLEKVEY